MPEEAAQITDITIPIILANYEVDEVVLKAAMGKYFVGELGTPWWFAILSVPFFQAKYEFEYDVLGVFPTVLNPVRKKTN